MIAKVEHTVGSKVNALKIFTGNCSKCHVGKNIESKRGELLFNAVCYMCHKDSLADTQLSKKILKKIVSNGLSGTSMPGFLVKNNGPLVSSQIDSLVDFIKDL